MDLKSASALILTIASPLVSQAGTSSVPQSATSFRELAKVDTRLKKLLEWDVSYACFRSDKDVFYLLSYQQEQAKLWRKGEKSDDLEQSAGAVFSEYRDGIFSETGQQFHFKGKWSKSDGDESAFFSAIDSDYPKARISIDDELVTISDDYLNPNKSPVHFHFTLQRSTSKAREEVEIAKPGFEVSRTSLILRCVVYQSGKLENKDSRE